jgi:L-alanine-DL-glutamate epimerase-like enolase superfamily enzyme
MGDPAFMRSQIEEKLASGFKCIKLKIGAIDFDQELRLLASIRERFDEKTIELRVDANGAFSVKDALGKLRRLSEFQIHSIEQPIAAGQYDAMAELCGVSPVDIALDEELIGVFHSQEKEALLDKIRPPYVILKPSLVGGFRAMDEWISSAGALGTKWWVTSALESNIGLNAIAQWTYLKRSDMPQGLGTGALYENNIESPLVVRNGALWYEKPERWHFGF